jgi:hypothetical protein
VLENYATGTFLASGDLPACSNSINCTDAASYGRYPQVDLAGDVMIDPAGGALFTGAIGPARSAPSGGEVRSASTGQVLATISGQFWRYQLASDGSYITTVSDKALTVYTPSGQQLFSLPGLYRTASAFSTPSAINLIFLTCPGDPPVCPSPGGTSVIETIAVPGGSPSAGPPFQGTFYAWFQDGARFMTTLGTTVYIYSSAGAQLDSKTVQPFNQAGTAQGPWWWTYDENSNINIYEVGAAAPTVIAGSPFLEPVFVSSATTLGVMEGPGVGGTRVRVIDLSGASPVSTLYTTTAGALSAYAATSATAWVTGDINGVVFDGASVEGQPRFLTLGAVQSIAAGGTYYSVATASGQIQYFNASTNASVGTIDFPSSRLAMSSDGSVLAAASGDFLGANPGSALPNSSVNVYTLPAGTLLNSFAYSSVVSVNISLSSSGTVLAQMPSNTSGCAAAAAAVTGGAPIWCDTTGAIDKVELSPDGTLVAASTQRFSSPNPTTSIYQNGTFVTTVPGWIVGWLDNSTFLVDNYQVSAAPPNDTVYLGNIIYNANGTMISKPSLPEAVDDVVIASDEVYSPANNILYSVTTNAPIWMSANPSSGIGAASPSQVVCTSETLVLAQLP